MSGEEHLDARAADLDHARYRVVVVRARRAPNSAAASVVTTSELDRTRPPLKGPGERHPGERRQPGALTH